MDQEVSDTKLLERVARLEQQVTALQQTLLSNVRLLDWLKQTVETNSQLVTLQQEMAEELSKAERQNEQKLKMVEQELITERAEHEDF
jgi:DNA-binding FrmR family transcriptional regulator